MDTDFVKFLTHEGFDKIFSAADEIIIHHFWSENEFGLKNSCQKANEKGS